MSLDSNSVLDDYLKDAVCDNATVLVVDDDRLVLMALKQTLVAEGFEIVTAQNGIEAVEILKEKTVAVILCDQRMPGMKGTEVMQEAIIRQPDAIRIIITGNSDEKTAIEAINKGHVSQFVIKPWDDNQLRQTVSNGIDQYRLMQQNKKLQELLLEKHKALANSHSKLKRDLQLGAMIHETLLMGTVPKNVEGLSLDATTIPSEEIDGDFFEFYQPVPGIFDVVIGDVMGKGIPAAVVGTAVKTQLIRFATPVSKAKVFDKVNLWKEDLLSPWQILSQVHNEISKKLIRLEYFVCLFYGRFNFGKRTFSYVDCGSTKPIHFHSKAKRIVELKGENFPLGMVEEDIFCPMEVHYSEGDFFVFYSDGVTESRSLEGELYGTERLKNIILESDELTASELLNKIKESVLEFAGKDHFDDDVTLIVVKAEKQAFCNKGGAISAQFRNDLSQLKAVRDFVERVCKKAPGDSETLGDQLKLVANEAFCNIVRHGHGNNENQKIGVQTVCTDEGVILELSDQGLSFNPEEIEEPNLAGDKDGGFGWHIIRSLANKVAYVPKQSEGGWNRLRIYKQYHFGDEAMELTTKEEENTLVISLLSENLDAKDAPDFKQKVIDLITSNNRQNIVFDLTRLRFIDSSGLGSFLAILRALNARNGNLKLVGMNKNVKTMFELVSMHKIFEILENKEEALRAFGKANASSTQPR